MALPQKNIQGVTKEDERKKHIIAPNRIFEQLLCFFGRVFECSKFVVRDSLRIVTEAYRTLVPQRLEASTEPVE